MATDKQVVETGVIGTPVSAAAGGWEGWKKSISEKLGARQVSGYVGGVQRMSHLEDEPGVHADKRCSLY